MKKILSAILRYIKTTDLILLGLCFFATAYGIVLISSATQTVEGNYIIAQSAALVLGIVLFVLFSLIDIDIFADKYKWLIVLGLAFIATLFVLGEEGGTGNRAWIRFGGFGIQPSEVVKIPFIIILAKMISEYSDRNTLGSFSSIFKLAVVFLMFFGLIVVASSDLGSALVYAFIFVVMLFVGGLKLRWFAAAAVLITAATPVLWNFFLNDNQKDRILAPYDPTIDPTGLGITWHATQSKSAISAGGFLGQGLFHGRMTQSGSIPQQHTDFIYAVAGEETGFIGCIFIIVLLMLIIIRCVYVGVKSNNSVGMLTCCGVAALLVFQTFENIGMCIGVTPVIGLTLPFLSYGGSSVITLFMAMGIVAGVKMRPKPNRFRRGYG